MKIRVAVALKFLDLFKFRSNLPVFVILTLSFWTSIKPLTKFQINREDWASFFSRGGYCELHFFGGMYTLKKFSHF